MSWVKASDPLALLAIQAGQVPNPSIQEGASGSSRLDVDQRSVDIGEPVPIVFARRRNNAGGVLISPGATEARFENDASNNVTAFYHLVLGEGQMDPIPVKDVFQRACRVGSHTQTYSRRAGTWEPGNFIVERVGYDKPEASYICGSIGLYPNMSTLSFQVTIPDGFDYWRRQVHVFIRGGMWVTRLVDSVTGPSDNFADLVRWMLLNNGRVPAALIDTTALTGAAQFLEANGFTCNCWLQQAENYGDFVAKWAPYFLLGESSIGGKKGLRPLLPVNTNGTIKTTAINWEYIFTEDEILPGTFDIEYTSWADRQPFVAQMTWRQELGDDAAIIRTADVRFINSAEDGPYESHDMSAFCTSEAHAVKAGAYIIARRQYVSHTIRFSARPEAHNKLLSPGSIIRVRMRRQPSGGSPSTHDYLYQIERITKTLGGDIGYECSHFPIDQEGRSIIAQIVTTATGSGILFDTNSTGIGCDINSATDDTIPNEEFTVPDIEDFNPDDFETVIDDIDTSELGGGATGGGGGGGSPDDGPGDGPTPPEDPSDPLPGPGDPVPPTPVPNPDDPFDDPADAPPSTPPGGFGGIPWDSPVYAWPGTKVTLTVQSIQEFTAADGEATRITCSTGSPANDVTITDELTFTFTVSSSWYLNGLGPTELPSSCGPGTNVVQRADLILVINSAPFVEQSRTTLIAGAVNSISTVKQKVIFTRNIVSVSYNDIALTPEDIQFFQDMGR